MRVQIIIRAVIRDGSCMTVKVQPTGDLTVVSSFLPEVAAHLFAWVSWAYSDIEVARRRPRSVAFRYCRYRTEYISQHRGHLPATALKVLTQPVATQPCSITEYRANGTSANKKHSNDFSDLRTLLRTKPCHRHTTLIC